MEKQSLNTLCKCRCSEVTLDEFIDCLVHKNYVRLVKTAATEEDMLNAWELLYGEYLQLSGSRANEHAFSLVRSSELLAAKLEAVRSAMALPGFGEVAALYGYRGELSKVMADVKRDGLRLKMLTRELAEQQQGKGEAMTEADFTGWIVAVSKHMGYRINPKEIYVSEFLEMSKQMSKDMAIKSKPTKR